MITTAKPGQPLVAGNDSPDMLVCPYCGQVIATHDTQGTSPNQTIAWTCIAGHAGTMTEQV